MDIKSMHYDFKKKLNKVDSQAYRNLRVPEIDWALNEAQELFIKLVAFPRLGMQSKLGFEKNQRTIDDIRTLVVPINTGSPGITPINGDTYSLPADYKFYVDAKVQMNKTGCDTIVGSVYIKQHDDEFEDSDFDKSSFLWRHVNATFSANTIKCYLGNDFNSLGELYLGYIKEPSYIHNAEAHSVGSGYTLPDGTVLTGTQNCELPDHTHREIVDIAVLITTGEIENQLGYQFNKAKFDLNMNT